MPAPQTRRTVAAPRPAFNVTVPLPSQQAVARQAVPAAQRAPVSTTPDKPLPSAVREMLRGRRSLRQGIILAEVLGPPLSLREDPR